MASIPLAQRLSRMTAFFNTRGPAPTDGRTRAADRIVAALTEGTRATLAELKSVRSAVKSTQKNSGAETARLGRTGRAILAELRSIRSESLAELRAIRLEHDADRNLWLQILGQQQAATRQLDTVGAIGLSGWQEKHPELASCSLVSSMLARHRAKRSVVGSTGLWMFFDRNREHLREISELLYERLPLADQQVFLKWLMFRWCAVDTLDKGERKAFMDLLRWVEKLPRVRSVRIGTKDYNIFDLNSLGVDIKFLGANYTTLLNDFYLNQYVHPMVQPRPGDVLLDLGGYNGDTAVMFGHNTGYDCQVHSFEMSTVNIEAFKANLELNPRMLGRTEINHLAVTDTTGATVTFGEGVQPGRVSATFSIHDGGTESVETITLDDYVARRSLDRVDVIKMDIEGAERLALRGAARTIARFKPRLAISLYHLEDDLLVLPKLILDANIDYRFGFRWYTKKNGNDGILFAIDADELGRIAAGGGPR